MIYNSGATSSSTASIIRRSITTAIAHRHHHKYHLFIRSSCSHFSSQQHGQKDTGEKEKKPKMEKMRIAIVGGGTAGLSTALHLAPLVSKGIIEGPVDLYECSAVNAPHPLEKLGMKQKKQQQQQQQKTNSEGEVEKDSEKKKKKTVKTEADWPNEYPGSGSAGRSIGVGIWSTALAPFRTSNHPTHQKLLKDMESSGSYVGKVGYRTPNGKWLARSELDMTGCASVARGESQPALLFLPEKDLLRSLKEAVKVEEHLGTIQTHYGSSPGRKKEGIDNSTCVESIHIPPNSIHPLGRLAFSDGTLTPSSTPYHLIVAADGMHSKLRSHYAGHFFKKRKSTVVVKVNQDRIDDWDESDQEETNAVEDRLYTVFRGCSPMSVKEMDTDGYSFQTWGEGDSMRFAVVSMIHPDDDSTTSTKQKEEQVWFITTSDPKISSETDPIKRKELLKQSFQTWHDPIGKLIDSTPPNDILMERALAHRHSVGPVFNVAEIALHEQELNERRNRRSKMFLDVGMDDGNNVKSKHGSGGGLGSGGTSANSGFVGLKESPNLGPALFFVGDANMTVDPVLAQGLTMAMEGGHALSKSVEQCCFTASSTTTTTTMTNNNNNHHDDSERITPLGFDPFELRVELRHQHRKLGARLLCLLRATEMVQTLAQPHSTLSGFLFKGVVRPAMRLAPDFVKRPIFDFMMRYSLGLTEVAPAAAAAPEEVEEEKKVMRKHDTDVVVSGDKKKKR